MNKSYRSIYNESLGAWVAASEITSARGKKSSSKKSALASGAILAVNDTLKLSHLPRSMFKKRGVKVSHC